MHRPVLILFLFFFSVGFVHAQSLIKGQVVDADSGDPLEFTTLSVLQGSDSTLVTGGYTNDAGNFSLAVAPDTYLLKIQFVSYETKFIDDVTVTGAAKDLGKVTLGQSNAVLQEVVVEGQAEQMVLELDKRVFNVAQDLSNTGRNASEILDNLPSVTVDVDGNVSLRGSGNVRVLVDGKPSGLIGIGDTDGLRTLQGDVIERVEVVTNPSARYDAEGSAGIINIVLKKKKKSGLNGSFTANLGVPENYGASMNMNFRKSWVNFFVNYGVNYRNTPGRGNSYQEFNLPDTTFITRRENNRLRGGLSHNIRVGTDFIINDYNTITASLLYNTSNQKNTTDTWYRDFTIDNDLFRRTLRTDDELEDEQNLEYEVYYKRTYEQKGRELSATVQFRESGEIEDAKQNEFEGFDDLSPTLFQRSLNDENERQWLIQADYVHPFAANAKFETGVRNTLRNIDNAFMVEELDQETDEWNLLPNFTNTFDYNENIYAGYAILSNKAGNWSYQGGLRIEATDIGIYLLETNERSEKNYVNFFPSAFLTYAFSKENQLQSSYSRRINRPGFRDLNPFFSFTDARNIRTGNPDLDPEFTDSYELGWLHNFTSGNIYFGAYYRFTDQVVARVSRVEDDGITYSRPENLSTENSFGFELNGSKDLTEWWNINGNVNVFRAITDGEAYGQDLGADTYAMSARFNSKWKIPNLFEIQLNGFYRGPQQAPQGLRLAYYSFDLGATRDILNKNGTLAFNVRDLFNTRVFRFEAFGDTFYQDTEFQWAVRQVTLSFTYRLNQNKSRRGGRGGGGYGGGDGDNF